MVNGFIQFTFGGSNERRSAVGHQTMSAVHDENSVVFARKHLPEFEKLRIVVERAMVDSRKPSAMPPNDTSSTAPPSMLEQLRDLGELHAKGIVDDTEFALLKAKLLAGQ